MKAGLKNFRYILKHKWFVLQACFMYYPGIMFQAVIHDMSQFTPLEFFAYTNYFQRGKNRDAFDRAWNSHQKRNKHHWQYWLLTNNDGTMIPLPMPTRYAQEMLCDWFGAAKAIGELTVFQWWEKMKDKIILHDETRQYIEHELIRIGKLGNDKRN